MIRRKQNGVRGSTRKYVDDDFRDVEGGEGGQAPIASPPGSVGGLPLPRQYPRPRRRKKTQNPFRSCLVRLQLFSDRSTKIESSLTRSGRKRLFERISLSFLLAGLIFVLLITLGLYMSLTGSEQKSKRNIILPYTRNSIPQHLMTAVRPEADTDLLPILIHEEEYGWNGKHSKKNHQFSDGSFRYPGHLGPMEMKEAEYVDFGDIDLKLLANDDAKRQIYIMVEDLQGIYRSLYQQRDDDYEQYWAFDDDIERNPYTLFDNYNKEMEGLCRRVSWYRLDLQNCNSMHELDLVTNTPRFIGDGAYREVFVTEQPYLDGIEEMILKELRWDLGMAYDDYEYVRMDAFVTERLTSNKQISDIYGFCGLSMLTEYFAYGDIENDVVAFPFHQKDFNPIEEPELKPYNNFTGSQKLKLALDMVEPVAALHNFKDGVIVHDDIQLCQYLWADKNKTTVKLNDFNRAEIMFWDETHEQYCKYRNGPAQGDWRSPEEYKDRPLDEKIDIWSLGNNMYSLLTGVYPFFNVEKDKNIQKLIKEGETAVIDPRYVDRSFAEAKLVEIIERCFAYNPEDRIDINELRDMLVEAIAEDEQLQKGASAREERRRANETTAKTLQEELRKAKEHNKENNRGKRAVKKGHAKEKPETEK